jgi:hypothetical protein
MQKLITTNEVKSNTAVVVSKEAVKDAPIKWGLNWISAPTPQKITWIFRVVLYAAFITSEVLPMFPEIPEHIALHISKNCLRAVALVHMLSKTFGIDISKVVPPSTIRPISNQ